MEATQIKEIHITLNNEEVKQAIVNYVRSIHTDLDITTDDIKILGNNDRVEVNLILRSSEKLLSPTLTNNDHKGNVSE